LRARRNSLISVVWWIENFQVSFQPPLFCTVVASKYEFERMDYLSRALGCNIKASAHRCRQAIHEVKDEIKSARGCEDQEGLEILTWRKVEFWFCRAFSSVKLRRQEKRVQEPETFTCSNYPK